MDSPVPWFRTNTFFAMDLMDGQPGFFMRSGKATRSLLGDVFNHALKKGII